MRTVHIDCIFVKELTDTEKDVTIITKNELLRFLNWRFLPVPSIMGVGAQQTTIMTTRLVSSQDLDSIQGSFTPVEADIPATFGKEIFWKTWELSYNRLFAFLLT